MKTSIIRLAVTIIPFITLVGSIVAVKLISSAHSHHSLSFHRIRRNILRALAAGVMVR